MDLEAAETAWRSGDLDPGPKAGVEALHDGARDEPFARVLGVEGDPHRGQVVFGWNTPTPLGQSRSSAWRSSSHRTASSSEWRSPPSPPRVPSTPTEGTRMLATRRATPHSCPLDTGERPPGPPRRAPRGVRGLGAHEGAIRRARMGRSWAGSSQRCDPEGQGGAFVGWELTKLRSGRPAGRSRGGRQAAEARWRAIASS